jgi:hypothetical protein
MRIRFVVICFFVSLICFGQSGVNPFEKNKSYKKDTVSLREKAPSSASNKANPASNASKGNPFEKNKTPSSNLETQDSLPANLETEEKPNNPFDIVPASQNAISSKIKSNPISTQKEKSWTWPSWKIQSTFEKEKNPGRFLFWGILICLVLFTSLFSLNRSILGRSYQGFLNENFTKNIFREHEKSVFSGYSLYFIFYILFGGMAIYLASNHFATKLPYSGLSMLLVCIFGLGILIFIKFLFLSLLSFVFPVKKEVGFYKFSIIVFGTIMAMVLIPFVVLVTFGPSDIHGIALKIMFGVWGLILAYRSLRGILIGERFISENIFHFLVYLCTVEIAPVFVLYRWVTDTLQI